MKFITKFAMLAVCLSMLACGSSRQPSSKDSSVLDYGSPNVKQTLLNDNRFKIDKNSDDPTYGYSEKNPIMVGNEGGGPVNERRFLNSLMGPDGEPITYSRVGSCCGFKTKNGQFDNIGLLDMYEVAHKGLDKPVKLYINMYDSDVLKIPVGFKKKK